MVSKVNFKAKILRHSRILKQNITHIHPIKKIYNRFWINSLFFIVVFLFPIYPLFSVFIYWENVYNFYKPNIDENSILDSYTETDLWEDYTLSLSPDSFISISDLTDWSVVSTPKENTIISKKEEKKNEIITYKVKSWDTLSKIALAHNVSSNSILWANNLTEKYILKPWEKIKIPPVSWVIYQVKSWDTISSISLRYNIERKKILLQNGIKNAWSLSIGQVLVLPWATQVTKKEDKKVVKNNTANNKNTSKNTWYNFSKEAKSTFTDEWWTYDLVKRKAKWRFAPWNCTWFVAQYKNVTWSWNARNWLSNARSNWIATWNEPSLWAIVVFNWRGYNPYYWHVWIVVWISWNNLIVKDMNYRRLYEVTTRKVPMNDSAIKWYIYVD